MRNGISVIIFCFIACILLWCCSCELSEISVEPDTTISTPSNELAPKESVETPEGSENATLIFQQDEMISIGLNADIIIDSGVLRKTGYLDFLPNGGWILGADEFQNILVLNGETYSIESVSPTGETEIILENILGSRNKKIECIFWNGNRYIAWSESPHAGEWYDETNGAEWAVYLADLVTKETICIDKDEGIRPDTSSIVTYVAPVSLSIGENVISYISFTKQNNQTVQTIMLYDIETKKLTPIGYLQGSDAENSLGHPSVSTDYVVWSQAFVRPDALYEGYSVIYEIATEKTTIWESDENVINPCVVENYLVCEGKPNETFYDGEIVVFDLHSGEMFRKISSKYPSYARRSKFGVNLQSVTASDNYFTWTGDLLTDVLLIDVGSGELFVISSNHDEITNICLYPGNLLVWNVREISENGELSGSQYYCFLK